MFRSLALPTLKAPPWTYTTTGSPFVRLLSPPAAAAASWARYTFRFRQSSEAGRSGSARARGQMGPKAVAACVARAVPSAAPSGVAGSRRRDRAYGMPRQASTARGSRPSPRRHHLADVRALRQADHRSPIPACRTWLPLLLLLGRPLVRPRLRGASRRLRRRSAVLTAARSAAARSGPRRARLPHRPGASLVSSAVSAGAVVDDRHQVDGRDVVALVQPDEEQRNADEREQKD